MMRLKVETTGKGLHTSEVVVKVKTSSGVERLVVSEREIQISLERKLIFIEPLPSEEAFSSTSVDLTLDAEITRFNANPQFMRQAIDVTHQDYDYEVALAQLAKH